MKRPVGRPRKDGQSPNPSTRPLVYIEPSLYARCRKLGHTTYGDIPITRIVNTLLAKAVDLAEKS